MSLPALLGWLLVPVLVVGTIYVIGFVPLVYPSLGMTFYLPDPRPGEAPLTIFEYGFLWFNPPAPLTGAT